MEKLPAVRQLLVLRIRQNIHSGYEVKALEDPWILTNPARIFIRVMRLKHGRILTFRSLSSSRY